MPIKIKKSDDSKYYFILIAQNGKTLCTSETYNQKRSLYRGIEAVKKELDTLVPEIIDETE